MPNRPPGAALSHVLRRLRTGPRTLLPLTPDTADSTWKRIAADLREAVGPSMFDIWLAPLRVARLDEEELLLEAPQDTRAWVAERFGRVLQASAAAVLGPQVIVSVVGVGGDLPSAHAGDRADRRPSRAHPGGASPAQREGAPLNPKYIFDQFVIGTGNRFAHGAALAVAENPGTAYNPLFLCGPPGVGKTHLLHSIGNYLVRYAPGLRVRVTTAEVFANEFIAALRAGGIDAFKTRYRENDVLLIDDVQFLMAKAKTEEEFFHTFNALRDSGAQIVLTSDRPPRDLEHLEDRLRDRFEAGLIADVREPDLATRLTALQKRAALDGITVHDDEVLSLIAARVTTNLRALEGALIRVVAFASLSGRPLTPELAAEVLDGLFPERGGRRPGTRRITIAEVQAATCLAFGITREELLSTSRAARLAWPRQIAMYLAREHTDASLPSIGVQFGGRNHTTVLHACKRASQRIAQDPEASSIVQDLTQRLFTGQAGEGADRRD